MRRLFAFGTILGSLVVAALAVHTSEKRLSAYEAEVEAFRVYKAKVDAVPLFHTMTLGPIEFWTKEPPIGRYEFRIDGTVRIYGCLARTWWISREKQCLRVEPAAQSVEPMESWSTVGGSQ